MPCRSSSRSLAALLIRGSIYMERKVAKLTDAAHPPASRSRGGTRQVFLISIISARDAHQFCLMLRKAILISGRSGSVISCARFQNGGSNGLEGSKDCRSVGGHGNQHVRLRSAQVSLSGVTCPVQEAIFAFELRQAPEGQNMQAERFSDFSKKFSRASFMPRDGDRSVCPDRAAWRRCDALL
jgi:hypothetical protein